MKKLLLLALISAACFAQALRIDPQSVQTVSANAPPGSYPPVFAIPGARVAVFTDSAATIRATTFTDVTASVACPTSAQVVLATAVGSSVGNCRATTDNQGAFGFNMQPGNYWYTITLLSGQKFGPFALTATFSVNQFVTQTGFGAVPRLVQNKLNETVSVKDYGATGDGVTDDTQAIQRTITTRCAGGSNVTVIFPAGTYLITSGITVAVGRCNLQGVGQNNSIIDFEPTAPGVALTFSAGAAAMDQNSLSELTVSSQDTTFVKTAIVCSDVRTFTMKDVAVTGAVVGPVRAFHDVTNSSVGFQLKGRDLSTFSKLSIYSDTALQLSKNPNTTVFQAEDLDQMRFYDNTLYSTTNPVIACDDGVIFSNTTFDGFQSWLGGSNGFYWNNTLTTIASFNLKISNARWEQAYDENGWVVYLNTTNGTIQNLIINNIGGASTGSTSPSGVGVGTNGVFLRKVLRGSLTDFRFVGAKSFIDTDSSVDRFRISGDYRPLSVLQSVPVDFSKDYDAYDGSFTGSALKRFTRSAIVFNQSGNTGTPVPFSGGFVAFKVTFATTTLVSSATLYASISGTLTNPTSGMLAQVWSDNAGQPGAVFGNSSSLVSYGQLIGSPLSNLLGFAAPLTFPPGTYWVGFAAVALPTGGAIVSTDSVATGSGNIFTSSNGVTWAAVGGTGRLVLNSPSATGLDIFSQDGLGINVLTNSNVGIIVNSDSKPAIQATSSRSPTIVGVNTWQPAISGISTHNTAVIGVSSIDGRGVSGQSNMNNGGQFVQLGSLTATTANSTVAIARQNTIGAFDMTGAVVRVDDFTLSTGLLFDLRRNFLTQFSVSPTGITTAGGGSANKAVCWKPDGKTLGFCSTAPDVAGACTCN
jgi:hypothetical protein